MAKTDVVARARKLISEGEDDDARELLVEAGFTKGEDSRARREYELRFPPGTVLKKHLVGALKQLNSKDRAARKRAIDFVRREAMKEETIERAEWLSDPKTTQVLIAALADRDPEFVEAVAEALGFILERYLPDLRAFDPLSRLLDSPRQQTRLHAAYGIGFLNHKDRWRVLVPLLKDESRRIRETAAGAIVEAAMSGQLNAATKRSLRTPLVAALSDEDAEVRMVAANGMREIGDKGNVKELKKALALERVARVKDSLKDALSELKA